MRWSPLLPALIAASASSAGWAQQGSCQLCAPQPTKAETKPARPLHIDIDTVLDFSTSAHTEQGAGSVTIDPRSGERRYSGLVGVGGGALRGTVTITGEPMARVSISLPVRLTLNSTMGAKADVTSIESTLGPDPVIGPDGRLEFHFGGKFSVIDDAAGEFHGRILISADYQ